MADTKVATDQVQRTLAQRGTSLAISGLFLVFTLVGVFVFWPQISSFVDFQRTVSDHSTDLSELDAKYKSHDDRIDAAEDAIRSQERNLLDLAGLVDLEANVNLALADFNREVAIVADQVGDQETLVSGLAHTVELNTEWIDGQQTRAATRIEQQRNRDVRIDILEADRRELMETIIPKLKLDIALIIQRIEQLDTQP